MKTVQSNITFKKDRVIKVYDKEFKFYDQKNYDSEIKVINKFKDSKHCVKIWDITDKGYTMERLDFDLGDDRCINVNNVRRLFFSLSLESILTMLDNMLNDLKSRGIKHRDINPGNILWSEKEKLLKFTDFFWSDLANSKVVIPGAVNQIYTVSDKAAIKKIKAEITSAYRVIEPELKQILVDFDDVGKNVKIEGKGRHAIVGGEYKDGSSIHRGWSYHVVDIPYFRGKIQHHKNTCIDEYNLIKENLPIKPQTVLDIGCSTGYQIFNFVRDFDLESAVGFEADPAVLRFLNSCKDTLKLKEVLFYKTFDDLVKIPSDIVIWINSHMWVYKQLGKARALEAVRNVIKQSKVLFFQTAGDYSSSIYKVTEYKNANDVKNMLYSAGAKNVTSLKTFVGMHGAPRDMFMVR